MVRSCDYPWKAYHETSARSPVMTILDHDPAIMTLDDRFGDGEAQAGMTAKGFAFGPDAMAAVKDRLTRTLWNARPFILHADHDIALDTGGGHPEIGRARIGQECVSTCISRVDPSHQ